jgi:hypothetical protein
VSPERPTLPVLPAAHLWFSRDNVNQAVRYFAQTLHAVEPGVLDALRDDAESAVNARSDVNLQVVADQDPVLKTSDCSTAGLYLGTTRPPTLVVAESPSRGRNGFTILHELAHHLQRRDPDWLLQVLAPLGGEAARLEHRVCDEFASHVLIPSPSLTRVVGEHEQVTAATLAAVFAHHRASRAAAIVRALPFLPPDSVALLTDSRGEILFCQSNGDLAPPPRGSFLDRDFIRRAISSAGSEIHGTLDFTYRTGTLLRGLSATATGDLWDGYVFVVATQETRFGQRSDWSVQLRECECGHEYAPSEAAGNCPRCSEPLCPECEQCPCRTEKITVCTRCFTALSVVEVARGLSAHDECP